MQKLVTIATLLLSLFAVSAMADELTGWISDSKCGAKRASAEHKGLRCEVRKGWRDPRLCLG